MKPPKSESKAVEFKTAVAPSQPPFSGDEKKQWQDFASIPICRLSDLMVGESFDRNGMILLDYVVKSRRMATELLKRLYVRYRFVFQVSRRSDGVETVSPVPNGEISLEGRLLLAHTHHIAHLATMPECRDNERIQTLAVYQEESHHGSPFLSDEAMYRLLREYDFDTVLDIGCGEGMHARVMARAGKKVTGVDYGESIYFKKNDLPYDVVIGDFNKLKLGRQFDCVWCSHVLEHQQNVDDFLRNIFAVLKEDGVLALSVPPPKDQIVGGHVGLWNIGLVLYRLILAGFDCRQASMRKYGYNQSVIVRKKTIARSLPLTFDAGDIKCIRRYLPKGLSFVRTGKDVPFDGAIITLNWGDLPLNVVCDGNDVRQLSRDMKACQQKRDADIRRAAEAFDGAKRRLVATEALLAETRNKMEARGNELRQLLEVANGKLREQCELHRREKESLRAEFSRECAAVLAEADAERERLTGERDMARVEAEKLLAERDAARTEAQKMRAERDVVRAEVEEAQKRFVHGEEARVKLEKELSERVAQAAEDRRLIDLTRAKLATRAKQLETSKDLATRLSEKLEETRKTLGKFKEMLAKKSEALSETSAKLAMRSKQLAASQSQTGRVSQQLASTRKAFAELKDKLKSKGVALGETSAKLAKRSMQLKASQCKYAQSAERLKAAEENLARLEVKLTASESISEERRRSVEEIRDTLCKTQELLTTRSARAEKAEVDAERYRQQIKELNAILNVVSEITG